MNDKQIDRDAIRELQDNEGCWYKFRPHLMELRYRIIMVILTLLLFVSIAFLLARQIFELMLYPLPEGITLNFFAPAEAFFTDIKIAVFAGATVSSPFILFHLWRFISPGLKEEERKLVNLIFPWLVVLFLIGTAFTFFIVVPAGLKILLGWGGDRLTPVISVGKYFGFLFGLLLAGGILFELPVILAGMARLGIITSSLLVRHFKSAIIIILILAALLTPSPDAFTMLLLAVPIILLYYASIFVVRIVQPNEQSGRKKNS